MILFLALIILIVVVVIALYNRLVKRKNDINNAFASIDVMLKKRFDLIPNLIELNKQFMNHEKETIVEIEKLHKSIEENASIDNKLELYDDMETLSNHLIIGLSQNSDTKANTNFIMLNKIWNTTEDQISAARRYYNNAVTQYNNAIKYFPSSIIANLFGYKEAKVFKKSKFERKNINTNELFNR